MCAAASLRTGVRLAPRGERAIKAHLSWQVMTTSPLDLAQVRLDNALALFEEFVRQTARQADAAALRGLEGRFAARVQIQPSYWSQIKSRSRQIGERLARQFEHLCHKPRGWMDLPHELEQDGPAPNAESARETEPRDDDERFIIGLVLTYYRRHPQRARTRLLDLLGEVLVPALDKAADPPTATARPSAPVRQDAPEDGTDLWRRSSTGIAPLKRKN